MTPGARCLRFSYRMSRREARHIAECIPGRGIFCKVLEMLVCSGNALCLEHQQQLVAIITIVPTITILPVAERAVAITMQMIIILLNVAIRSMEES